MKLWERYKAECRALPRWAVYALFIGSLLCAYICYTQIQLTRHPDSGRCAACNE